MKNCRNKNGLPMKWVMRQPFHGGHYEYYYSDIGMGCHNLELFARVYPTNVSDFRQSDNRLDTVYLPANHPSFQDALATLRKVLWRKRIIVMFGNHTVPARIIEFFIKAVAAGV